MKSNEMNEPRELGVIEEPEAEPVQMCCDGRTKAEHSHGDPNGRCCVDRVE